MQAEKSSKLCLKEEFKQILVAQKSNRNNRSGYIALGKVKITWIFNIYIKYVYIHKICPCAY